MRAIIVFLVLCGFASLREASAADRPNILFIMSDDHTSQAVGAYGGRLAKLNPTPTLDQLAREGMRFDRVFCNNSICTPSRATHSHRAVFTAQRSARPRWHAATRAAVPCPWK